MAIYMKVDGIRGDVRSSHPGGVLVSTADGSVRFNRNSVGGVNGGVWKTGNFIVAENSIEISRVTLRNGELESGFVDSKDASAVLQVKTFFDAARSGLETSNRITVSTAVGGNTKAKNDLRQTAKIGKRIPLIGIFVSNGGKSPTLAIELENCLISSYSNTHHQAQMIEHFELNFTKIKSD